jgi:pimeloyl-ACP methyl ester carboxylesterase
LAGEHLLLRAHLEAEHTHLVAIDLPGFGQSERRNDLMSPRAMGEFIVRAADAFGLEQPHVVGPDIGTGTSLFAAALHPGRFRSLVVGTGGAAVPLQLGGVLKEWVEAPSLEPYRKPDCHRCDRDPRAVQTY